ncbi:MAG: hypothetical protein JXR23_04155 [Pontiellaceae bacterium]|nr:hypothetical protein [Pontiellaceae bacterium]
MKKLNKSKDAFVLLIALAFVSLLALGSTFLLRVSTQKAYTENKRVYTEMARIIAESGVHISVSAIERDNSLIGSGFDPIPVGDGTATITITETDLSGDVSLSSTSSNEKYYVLSSTGTWGNQVSTVGVLFRYTPASEGDSEIEELFGGAIFCGGDITMAGGTSINLAGSGSVHANGNIRLTGGARFNSGSLVSTSSGLSLSGGVYVDADVNSATTPSIPNWATYSSFISGSVSVGNVPEKMIEINLDPYRLYAENNDIPGQSYKNKPWNYVYTDSYISADELKNGKLQVGSMQVVRPVGGVLWVEGEVKFAGGSVVDGCVIATGDIDVRGGMTHKPANGLPSFMSVSGNVDVGSGCTVYGLVYSHTGNIDIRGGATVQGAFICPRGDFTNHGGGSVVYDNSTPMGPNGEDVMQGVSNGGSGGSSGGAGGSGSEGILELVRWVE